MQTGSVQNAVIALNESLSGAVVQGRSSLIGIVMPAAWTAANLTFSVSADGVTYNNLYDEAGSEFVVTAAAARYIYLDPTRFAGVQSVKVRSGTAGTAVNQEAERTLGLVFAPLWVG